MSEKKKSSFSCYFSQLFKLDNVLPILLFTALAITAFALNYEFELFREIRKNSDLLLLSIVAVSIVAAMLLAYMIACIKNKKICLADLLASTLVLTAVFFFIYSLVKFGTFNLRRALTVAIAFVIGFTYVVLSGKYYDKDATDNEIIYTKNSMWGYFSTVFRKYNFISIIATAILSVSVAYLAFDPTFRRNVVSYFYKYPALSYISGIAAGLAVLYLFVSAFSKKVNVSDVAFLSTIITMPVILAQILVKNNGGRYSLTIWAVLLAVILVFALIRFLRFDLTVKSNKELKGDYFKQLSSKYNPLFIVAISGLIVAAVAIIYKARLLQTSFNYADGTFNPQLKSVLLVLILGTIAMFFIWALIVSALGLKSKKITVADFALSIITLTALFAISFFAFSQVVWILACILVGVAVCLALLIARLIFFIKANR